VEDIVVGLNLCPFARREVLAKRVRYVLSEAVTDNALLEQLHEELDWLNRHPDVETTLLVHPAALTDFDDYNQFLEAAEALLAGMGLEGTLQLASFHPAYRFAGTCADAAENYTNRSPYPLLHILREASVEAAVERTDTANVPERNIRLMNELGTEKLRALLQATRVPPSA